ncbi:tetratricopeptide repeat protein [Microbulbifer sp. PAAF003]|uniref:tetratricopeptide repeat protein n=1 Tax=Microbulbifer sp. PAAF003 TaxID=3243375 RepID=UPI0040396F10
MKLKFCLLIMLPLILSCAKAPKADSFKVMPHGYYRQLLLEERFQELENIQATANKAYISGKVSDAIYIDVFGTLWFTSDHKSGLIESKLKMWLEEFPESAFAYSALGRYYYRRGQYHRGNKWASQTSESSFKKLYADLELANTLVVKALEIDPDLIRAYDTSIGISIYSKGNNAEEAFELLLKGVKHTQNDFPLWHTYMHGLKPRWGGSYFSMEEMLKLAQRENLITESTHRQMKGYIIADKVNRANAKKKYELAESLAREHIDSGYYGLYMELANAYSYQKKYQECYDVVKQFSDNYQYYYDYQKRMGWCSLRLEKWGEAKHAFTRYIQMTGGNAWSFFNLGKAYGYLDNYPAAYTLLIHSAKIDPSYSDSIKGYIDHILDEKPNTRELELSKLGL